MNDVQLENGFTRIANEILDNIAKLKLSSTQHSIIYVIWRYTYGFNRKEHIISLSFLAKAIDTDKRNIQRELKRLENRQIIRQTLNGQQRIIAFNKNYNQWDKFNGEITNGELTNGEITNSTDGEITNSTDGEITNQERKKENIKENSTSNLINDLFEELWKLYPNKKGKSTVSKKSKQVIYKIGIDKMTTAINNYKQDLQANTWKQAMNGSTFFNSRYEDYFEINHVSEELETTSIYPEL
ncbi:phage replication O-like protein O [Sedimentibacter acidaminivorans]|uniref:Phage replication O-like protein O n=1 Tax=Sedimentibacter acidaminivorans TaxID=913099 RepID=A0ABS4GDR7_9FIRM|nr:phage replication O-like protein O [Sedimentibacter acidaminivorans]